MNNRKENEQSCIVMNKKEGTSDRHTLFSDTTFVIRENS